MFCKIRKFVSVLLVCIMTVSTPLQVHATSLAIPAGIALVEIIKDLVISAGIIYLGYESVSELMTTDSSAYEGLEYAILHDATVAEGIELARQWEETDGSSALDSSYSYSTEYFRVIGGGNSGDDGSAGAALNRIVNIGLSAKMIQAARAAAKAWADSEDARVTGLYKDSSIPVSVSGTYNYTVSYEVHSMSVYPDFTLMDFITGYDGINDFINANFEGDFWVLTYNCKDSSEFCIIPYDYLFVGDGFISKENFVSFIKNACFMNYSDLSNAFKSIKVPLDGYMYKYVIADGILNEISKFSFEHHNYHYANKCVAFGYGDAVQDGSFVRTVTFGSNYVIEIHDMSCDVTQSLIEYDDSNSSAIPDYWDVPISEDDLDGFSFSSLAALIDYIMGLVDSLKGSSGTAGGLTDEQAKSILSGINNVSSGINNVSVGIGKVVDEILAIPDAFADIFLDGKSLTGLINSLPDAIADALGDVIALPDSIALPDEVSDAIISVPDAVIKGLKGVVITVPEIKVPEIAAPDVDVTLNPEIIVENDFAGLGDVISASVKGVLEDVFVPDYAVTVAKADAVAAYFDFVDDVTLPVGTLINKMLGIEPSPYLKIPLGDETSKYNYGFGDYWIIDISWYAKYKSYGDKVILAIVWSFFLWHLYLKLPGIISGTEGQIMAGIRANIKYNSKADKYYYKNGGYGQL